MTSPNNTLHPEKSTNWLWRGISLGIATLIIIYMLSLVEWNAFVDVILRLSLPSMVAAFAVYVLLNLWRSFRFVALLKRDNIPVLRVFPIALYHNFLVRLLPFKLGEFAYIMLMRNRMDVPVEEGVSSLFGSRLLELLMILLVGAVALLGFGGIVPNQSGLAIALVVGCIVLGVIGFYYTGTFIRIFIRFLRPFARLAIVSAISKRLDSLALEFDRIRSPHVFGLALFWSCFTYGSSFAVNYILLVAVGVDVSLGTLTILVSIGMFATAFPFNISGFGMVELGWTWGLTQFAGYTVEEAVSIGLMLNGFQLICAAISGIGAYGVVHVTGNKRIASSDLK